MCNNTVQPLTKLQFLHVYLLFFNFLYMPHSNRVCILSHVRDNALESYLGHIKLSRTRDVIADVIIRSAIDHFLLVGIGTKSLS